MNEWIDGENNEILKECMGEGYQVQAYKHNYVIILSYFMWDSVSICIILPRSIREVFVVVFFAVSFIKQLTYSDSLLL